AVPVEGVKDPILLSFNEKVTNTPASGPTLESTTCAATSAGAIADISTFEIPIVTVITLGGGVVPEPSSVILPPPPHATKKSEHNPARKTLYADFIVRLPVTLVIILRLTLITYRLTLHNFHVTFP